MVKDPVKLELLYFRLRCLKNEVMIYTWLVVLWTQTKNQICSNQNQNLVLLQQISRMIIE